MKCGIAEIPANLTPNLLRLARLLIQGNECPVIVADSSVKKPGHFNRAEAGGKP